MRSFYPGDHVWVQSHSRVEAKWSLGKILQVLGPVTYLVQFGEKSLRRHVDHIRLASTASPPPSSSSASACPQPPTMNSNTA